MAREPLAGREDPRADLAAKLVGDLGGEVPAAQGPERARHADHCSEHMAMGR
jgi:hypothetical protein